MLYSAYKQSDLIFHFSHQISKPCLIDNLINMTDLYLFFFKHKIVSEKMSVKNDLFSLEVNKTTMCCRSTINFNRACAHLVRCRVHERESKQEVKIS